VETVQPLLLDHQSVEWLIGHVGTLEEFGLVESMQVLDILHFCSFLECFSHIVLHRTGKNLSLINHGLVHRLSHHSLK
jgi:hypothetical protein